ncbi:MAG TPA: glycoside hydrolase [Blastocatellia bacterium]|nr:glycoside hydrolase [Blastocatellia bacterium]
MIRRIAIHATVLLCLSALAVSAQTPKRIYIAPDDHTDYMWTMDEEAYRTAFIDMLDYYLSQMDATAGNPSPYQGRWNCDGSFWLWTYERNKSAAEFNRLIGRLRDGHLSAPLTALVSCYGGAPAEAVLRGMYYPGTLERRFNLRFPMAVAMENQTLPYGLGSLWAGAGAKYSWRGICSCATKVASPGDREHDIYWWNGFDGSRLLMKWNTIIQNNESIGGYAEARSPFGVVELVDSNPTFQSRFPYRVIGAFGKGWDDARTFTDEFITAAQQLTNANRQVIVSNEQDFFQDFEANYGALLPTVSASFGNEWDLYCASMAEVSARVKRSLEKLRSAEALATLVSLRNPGFMNGRTAARDQAWMNLGLYWEHDWTADGPVSRDARAAWQRRIAGEIESYVSALHNDAAAALGGLIRKSGSSARFYAFNALSWSRTDVADLPFSDAGPVYVVDLATGQETPSQIVSLNGQRLLRVLARDVPPVGYKVFEIRSGSGSGFTDAATVTGSVLENSRYRLTVADRGAITSLIDKARGNREFARNINGRFINDLGAGSGAVQVENAGPVSVTLRADAAGPLSHTTRVTLIRDKDRIEIRNEITQNFGDVQTWGFGFNLDSPDLWHEEVGAVIRARLTTQGGHYSPRNARYDWLTLNHFADLSGSGAGVTLSNADCYFMQLGNSTPSVLDTNTPLLSVLAGGQVDGTNLGIPGQGGDSNFTQRFALQTRGAYDPAAAMRFALEHQNPLVTALVTGNSSSAYPESSSQFVTISNPNVLLWSLKPAEEGIAQGIIARTWNLSDSAASYQLQLASQITAAVRTTHIETNLEAAAVNNGALAATAAPQQLQTFRLTAGNTSARPFVSVSAANYGTGPLAVESIAAAFGTGLATSTQAAATVPLPTTLAGTTVIIRDSAGIERAAPLFFVSPTQLNYQIPPDTAAGAATITITAGDGTVSVENTQIAVVRPGLFTADSSGQGLAAAYALRVRAGGAQFIEPVARFDQSQNRYVAVPIDLGPDQGADTDQVFLVLFGTGFRHSATTTLKIGSASAEITYAGPQGDLIGLDQLNARIPRSLTGSGEVDVVLQANGQTANPVRISIR